MSDDLLSITARAVFVSLNFKTFQRTWQSNELILSDVITDQIDLLKEKKNAKQTKRSLFYHPQQLEQCAARLLALIKVNETTSLHVSFDI